MWEMTQMQGYSLYESFKKFFSFFGHAVRLKGLILQSGTEPAFSALKASSPNHWTVREFPMNTFKNKSILKNLKEKLQIWFGDIFFQNHLRANCWLHAPSLGKYIQCVFLSNKDILLHNHSMVINISRLTNMEREKTNINPVVLVCNFRHPCELSIFHVQRDRNKCRHMWVCAAASTAGTDWKWSTHSLGKRN